MKNIKNLETEKALSKIRKVNKEQFPLLDTHVKINCSKIEYEIRVNGDIIRKGVLKEGEIFSF